MAYSYFPGLLEEVRERIIQVTPMVLCEIKMS
jgi:hypothetical protein